MAQNIYDRTLALAGVFQAVQLVEEAAKYGHCDEAATETSINSIFKIDVSDAESVFGRALCVSNGLRLIQTQFGEQVKPDNHTVSKYLLGILYIEKKLARRPQLLAEILAGIERAKGQLMHYPPAHANILASLADTYSKTVSTITPRLIIEGEEGYLTRPDVANSVRALLLAAVRAAVLWSQCGGTRWQIMFGRQKLVHESRRILNSFQP